ncbi:MAG: hypothetical protein LAP39_10880 [Acidobacteriia bacterium]|nr:hypothetical protein [Terriglobia bacterium]
MSFSSCSKLIARFVIGLLLAGTALCQSISIVSGDGQLLQPLVSGDFVQPLVVLVRDAAGNPLPNATVTWAVVTLQGGGLAFITTKTDSTGQTSNSLAAPALPLNYSFFQTSINAVYSSKSVTFTETVVGQIGGGAEVAAELKTPPLGTNFVGSAGQHSSTIIQVLLVATVGAQTGTPVGHVLVKVGPADKAYTSTLTCVEGASIFTDIHGLATCTPVFGGQIGTGVALVQIGNFQFQFNYQVTAGPPAVIAIIGGNNQSGQPGQPLPLPLVAQLTDVAGNWLTGVKLNFRAVVAGTVAFSNVSDVTDVHGEVSAIATPGNTTGPVAVSVETPDGKVFVAFTINVAANVGQILKSGDQQTGFIGQTFTDPLVITVNDPHGNPIQGAQVAFAVTQGSATVGSATAVTNGLGQASTTVTAGNTPGPIVVTATVGKTVATFSLTSRPPGPSCTAGQTFYNGAGFQANYISPGVVATIYCVGLAQGIQGSVMPNLFGPLPTQVAGVSLTFATAADPGAASLTPNAPIFNVSNYNGSESVTVQVPLEALVGQSVPVTITAGAVGTLVNATILPASPGVFDTGAAGPDGLRAAVVLRPDGSVVSPSNPIARGEVGRAFITGLIPPAGLTTNAQLPIDSDIVITTPVIVGINNAGVKVNSVKYAANLVGVWEVQFTVPSTAPTGSNIAFVVAIPVPGASAAFSQVSDLAIQ